MEWIIIDDGTDKVGDLLTDIPQVKYFAYDEKMSLGKKRNLMHTKSKGDILVYMDDDDYYPPERVSHAVQKLRSNTQALCAGSSEVHIHFKHINKIIQFGPYGPNHATAGTFAFKRKLLDNHKYEDSAALAEERAFLDNYTVPFVQLDTRKTILVFSHNHNTFDKRKLLENPHPKYVRDSPYNVDHFVKEKGLKKFFMEDIDAALEAYEPGRPEMKPDVLKQIVEIEEERRKMKEQASSSIVIQHSDGRSQTLTKEETVAMLSRQQNQLMQLSEILRTRDNEIAQLKSRIKALEDNQAEKVVEKVNDDDDDDVVELLINEVNN
jgi:glycosyltransferase involved in cell wall biosynthesis